MKSEIYPDPELERDTPNTPKGPENSGPGGWLGFLLRTKIQFRLLGALFYILFASQTFHLTAGNIFMAVLAWELVEIYGFRMTAPAAGLLALALSMSGLSPKQTAIATRFLEIMTKTSMDVATFMQAFVMVHFVYCKVWLRLDLETIFFAGTMQSG